MYFYLCLKCYLEPFPNPMYVKKTFFLNFKKVLCREEIVEASIHCHADSTETNLRRKFSVFEELT